MMIIIITNSFRDISFVATINTLKQIPEKNNQYAKAAKVKKLLRLKKLWKLHCWMVKSVSLTGFLFFVDFFASSSAYDSSANVSSLLFLFVVEEVWPSFSRFALSRKITLRVRAKLTNKPKLFVLKLLFKYNIKHLQSNHYLHHVINCNCNYNYILFNKLPRPRESKIRNLSVFEASGHLSTTHGGGFTISV